MSKLETKLGLVELTTKEMIYKNPDSNSLKFLPKNIHTTDILEFVCEHDGIALKHASKKLINPKLCEIAINQNGIALEYVPEKVIKTMQEVKGNDDWYRRLCEKAVRNNGRAIQFVPKEYIDKHIAEQAVSYYLAGYVIQDNSLNAEQARLQGEELSDWYNYPITYIPKDLITKELLIKAVSYSPFCLRDIEKKKITKELVIIAVKTNGLSLKNVPKRFLSSEIVELAINNNPLSVQYAPKELINQEICDRCFDNNYMTISFIPEEYVNETMCLSVIEKKRFSIFRMSSEQKEKVFSNPDVDIVVFTDFPEKMRNNKQILDSIIKRYKYGSLPLIKWNEDVENDILRWGKLGVKKDNRGNIINILQSDTLEYLQTKIIQPEKSVVVDVDSIMPSVYVRDIKKQLANITLQTPTNTFSHDIVVPSNDNAFVHYFSEESDSKKVYYVSDIHIEHHLLNNEELRQKVKKAKSNEEKETCFLEWIDKKVAELIAGAKIEDVLLIGGDVANSIELSKIFHKRLRLHWRGTIISILGNHELWDGTSFLDWMNKDFHSRPVEEIIKNYKAEIENCGGIKLLENEIYIKYKNTKSCIIPTDSIISCQYDELKELLNKSSFIVLGGIGFSGLNPKYNAELGLYRKAITSIDEDKERTETFQRIYEKVKKCASNKRVIILTHTPVYDWTSDSLCPNWIYVNGHTHINSLEKTKEGIMVLSDNQIGYGLSKIPDSNPPKYIYNNPKWKLNSFVTDKCWYDPFENYNNGIYTITSEEYKDFNYGRGIMCNGCSYDGTLYMLKQNEMYMFLLKTSRTLCLLSGGQRKKLNQYDVQYYYDNMAVYGEHIKTIIKPYQNVMQQISEEVKKIGGDGTIHGCIVDISFFSHIYVNPFDGKITSYWAEDILSRQPFDSIQKHIEQKEPQLLQRLMREIEKKSIPLIEQHMMSKNRKCEVALIPQWVFGTEMYEPSRIMKAVQYVWEQNVIRIWNDDILKNTTEIKGIKRNHKNTKLLE